MDNRTGLGVNIDDLGIDREVEDKLIKLTGSSFEILIQQSENKYDELSELIAKTRATESRLKKYYSTDALHKRIMQGLISELQLSEQSDALNFIQQKHSEEHERLIHLINASQQEYKEIIKKDLIILKNAAATIAKMRDPLIARVDKFKNALIDTLIDAAKEYQRSLIKNGAWKESKITEFLDKSSSLHLLRKNSLDDIVKMINDVISECVSGDSYYGLKIIKNHFDDLVSKQWKGYFYLETEWKGMFVKYEYLKALKLTQSEYELKNIPIQVVEGEFKKSIINQDASLLKDITESLDNLQKKADLERKHADDYTCLIKQELRVAVNLLSGPSEKCYKQIAGRNASMKMFNAEVKMHSINQSAALHRVQVAYEDAIHKAKQREKNEFEQLELQAIKALQEADESMQKAKDLIENLQRIEKNVRKELNSAKEIYDGSCHRIYEAQLARECKKYEKRKASYIEGQKEYHAMRVLPKALKAYGEIVLSCAEMQAESKNAQQVLKDIPKTAQLLWTAYHDALVDAKVPKIDRFVNYKQTIDQGLVSLSEDLKKSDETISIIKVLNETVEKKLQKAQKEFLPTVHDEYQDIYDLAVMQYSDAVKQNVASHNIFSSAQEMPQAFAEYTGIISRCAVIENEMVEVKKAATNVKLAVESLQKIYDEAGRLAEVGVAKRQLKMTAMQKYDEARLALSLATQKLKKAEEIKLAEQERLEKAKAIFSSEMHAKPQAIFDEMSSAFSDTVVTKKTAEIAFASIQALPRQLDEKFNEAKKIEKEKQIATQLRQLMLNAILNNLHLWHMGKWGGGINYQYNGQTFRIPHGVLEMIAELSRTVDYNQWIAKVVEMASNREMMGRTLWKYRFFNIRDNETTGKLYHVIKENLNLTERSIESLRNGFETIKGLRLEINNRSLKV